MLLLFAAAFLSLPPQQASDEDAPQPWIYYDYVEDGVLRGGIVQIDPANPLHTLIGDTLEVSASPYVTLVDNGPSANRVDLVFVGDGYTAADLVDYFSHVDSIYPQFFSEPPLAEYVTFFNIHRVDVVSNESGVDNDPTQGVQKDTALDMAYWCGGIQRLLCVNVLKANSQANSAPDVDQILAVANSTKYGGAGYTDLGTLAGNNSASIEVALHEFGHSFANLADEYHYGDGATYTGSEPNRRNVSTYDEVTMAGLEAKWFRWLDLAHVSTFEGAFYNQFGVYRPTGNSKMRSLNRPFQEVNTEGFVRNIYAVVDPIDDATRNGTYLYTDSFFVATVDPVGRTLDVQWKLDDVPIAGATAKTLDASTLGLTSGIHVLSVEVVDNTPLVRDEDMRAELMTSERSWKLTRYGHKAPSTDPVPAGGVVVLDGVPAIGSTLVLGVHGSQASVPTLLLTTGSGERLARLRGHVIAVPIPNDPALVGLEVLARTRGQAEPLRFTIGR